MILAFPKLEKLEPEAVWPDPIPLASTLLPVAPFDPEMLPLPFRGWAQDISDRMNVPLDFVAVPAMVAASTLIGRKVAIRPEVHSNWIEAANVWGATVGPPGTLKSPAVREAFSALHALEKEAAAAHELALERLRPEQLLFEIEEAQAKQTAKSLIKKGGDDPFARHEALQALGQVTEPVLPMPRRYVTNDATPEKLGELCRGNPDGLLIHRDELLTMFTELDQEEKAAGRGFIMSGWTGLDGYTVDRIGRGTVRIPAVNLALFGTIQPNRLTSYMRKSFALHDDGLMQRLQLLVWPDLPRKWKLVDRPRDEALKAAAMASFERLAQFDADQFGAMCERDGVRHEVPYLRFDYDAQDAFDVWRERLEDRVSQLEAADPWRGHMAKYRGLAPRIAMLCHIIGGGRGGVSLQAWLMAEKWIAYLETHALRAYDAMRTDNTDTAQRLAAKIKDGALGEQFTAREVYRPQWSGLKKPADVEPALKMLVDYDWLSPERVGSGGKPKVVYRVNPKVAYLAV